MFDLTRDEVAARAGASLDDVARFTELKILAPAQGRYRLGDVYRARLLVACEAAGIPAESLAKVIEDGSISLDFADQAHYRWSPLLQKTYADAARDADIPLDTLLDVIAAATGARRSPDDLMREDDDDFVRLMQMTAAFMDRDAQMRTARVYGDSLRRVVEAETNLFDTLLVNAFVQQGLRFREAVDLANAVGAQTTPLQESLLMTIYRRQQERFWTDYVVGGIEGVLEQAGLHTKLARPPAMAFVDLAGFTRMTEEEGDAASARVAGRLAGMVDDVAHANAGQAVKWLGDGVMVYFKDARGAVDGVLDIVGRAPEIGLPAHAGIAAGPIVMQDGDYYGRTVNMAARIAARATAGQTLVSRDVVEHADGSARFTRLEAVELKGFAAPIDVFEARLIS